MIILHEKLLQQQLSQKSTTAGFNSLDPYIVTTLDNMAFGIAQKEGLESFDVKQKLVANINKLGTEDLAYLVEQISILIDKSVHDKETIDDTNVDKSFITFLIKLYY